MVADPWVPIGVRVALAELLVWLIGPVNLSPSIIHVLGPLDDVVLAVLVLRYVRRRLWAHASASGGRGATMATRCWRVL